MKPVSGKDFAKALMANGWQLDHIRGSHHYFVTAPRGLKSSGFPIRAVAISTPFQQLLRPFTDALQP